MGVGLSFVESNRYRELTSRKNDQCLPDFGRHWRVRFYYLKRRVAWHFWWIKFLYYKIYYSQRNKSKNSRHYLQTWHFILGPLKYINKEEGRAERLSHNTNKKMIKTQKNKKTKIPRMYTTLWILPMIGLYKAWWVWGFGQWAQYSIIWFGSSHCQLLKKRMSLNDYYYIRHSQTTLTVFLSPPPSLFGNLTTYSYVVVDICLTPFSLLACQRSLLMAPYLNWSD